MCGRVSEFWKIHKMVKAKGERIKDLQMRLDRANDTIEEMVESRREFLDV